MELYEQVFVFLIKGFWATVTCLRKQAEKVFLLNRPSSKCDKMMKELEKEKKMCTSNTELVLIECDLTSFQSGNFFLNF